MFVMVLLLLSLSLMLQDHKMGWPIMVLLLFGYAAISEWNRRGPMPDQVKVILERRGLRPIHLWLWVIGIYYAIVGFFCLL